MDECAAGRRSVETGGGGGDGPVAWCASAWEEILTHDVVLFYMMMTKYIFSRPMTLSLCRRYCLPLGLAPFLRRYKNLC